MSVAVKQVSYRLTAYQLSYIIPAGAGRFALFFIVLQPHKISVPFALYASHSYMI